MSFDLAIFAADCHVKDPETFVRKCDELRNLLEETNQVTNLTRIVGEREFAVKHAADSLGIARFFPELAEKPLRVADVGCGAGFPSIILALAFPDLRITAIDSTGKKIAFVLHAVQTLGLKNLTPVHGRANELNRKTEFIRHFDIVTARAVAAAKSLVHDTDKFLVPGGRFILYQSPERAEQDAAELGRMHRRITESFDLPEDAGKRCFLEISPDRR